MYLYMYIYIHTVHIHYGVTWSLQEFDDVCFSLVQLFLGGVLSTQRTAVSVTSAFATVEMFTFGHVGLLSTFHLGLARPKPAPEARIGR